MKIACIVVAAGRGSRASSGDSPGANFPANRLAKQYVLIGGVPMLARALAPIAAHPEIGPIVVVIHPDDRDLYDEATASLGDRLLPPVIGGATRQESVRLGLEALVSIAPDHVLIHDAARPFVSAALIDRVIAALESRSGAIPALAVFDTLKRSAAGMLVGTTVARNGLFRAQTPQAFEYSAILAAHRTAAASGRSDFTDDASVAEAAGLKVAIVDGEEANRKLTTAEDIAEANQMLAAYELVHGPAAEKPQPTALRAGAKSTLAAHGPGGPGDGATVAAAGKVAQSRDGKASSIGAGASRTPLLDLVRSPAELREMEDRDLPALAAELRQETVDAVSVTGGHLGAGLGVIELTIALHKVFDTPRDKIIWDVGHQAYPHKILTGRRDRIRTLRQAGGLSGFTKRAESEYDPFGAAHSSTSISAGLGMAVARDIKGESNNVIAVIGDGAMSAGMAYEAMNNAGARNERLIVILNDNDMSIAPPVGAISAYLARLSSSSTYFYLRDFARQLARRLPKSWERRAARWEELTRTYWTGGTLFEELGFHYVGPIDGHSFDHLLPVLRNVRDARQGPILVHVVTKKGKGYGPAEAADDKYHGVNRFNVITGAQDKPKSNAPSYTRVFADSLMREARRDPKIVAITAAMPSGTGLDLFMKEFADRTFDVGIAEQHAVTFAAGLASEGLKPFCAIYSTFLQRAYDQIVHDVAIQKLPVRFAIDRAGLVGADGPTHAGSFDIAYLGCLPGFVLMAPGDEAELMHMVATAAAYDEGPIGFRFPRGDGIGIELPAEGRPLEIGRGRILKEGTSVALLSYGGRLADTLRAADMLEARGLSTTVADARFAKPLDTMLLRRVAREHELLVTIEEGSVGGFGSHVLHQLARDGLLDRGLKVRTMTLPDIFQDQASPAVMVKEAGLSADGIVAAVMAALPSSGTATRQLEA